MIYVDIVYKNIFGHWKTDTKEFACKEQALRGMYAMKSKGLIIDGWRCDDPIDHQWLTYRFKV